MCESEDVDGESLQWVNRLNMGNFGLYMAALGRFTILQEMLQEFLRSSYLLAYKGVFPYAD